MYFKPNNVSAEVEGGVGNYIFEKGVCGSIINFIPACGAGAKLLLKARQELTRVLHTTCGSLLCILGESFTV